MSDGADIAIAAGKAFWHVIESNKPSANLVSEHTSAVPAGISDPVSGLTGAQGPNQFAWRLTRENYVGMDVVDIVFDLRWEFGARYKGGGAYIPNCYLYVPVCDVFWGQTVNIQVHVHNPSNAGTEAAPIARLPLTVSGSISNMLQSQTVQWDFVVFGNGKIEAS